MTESLGQEYFLERLMKAGAVWRAPEGTTPKVHALLTSGLHSDFFFNASKLIEKPRVLKELVVNLLILYPYLARQINKEYEQHYVVGSAFGGISLAYQFALILGCNTAFTEKNPEQNTMDLNRFDLPKGSVAILVEDVITTGGTLAKTMRSLQDKKIQLVSPIYCILNRSGSSSFQDIPIRACASLEPKTWEPDSCPLCKADSLAIHPKSNWERFVNESS